jgi:hypothetical protein
MDTVARLAAIEEIRQLKSRYFRTMDTRDWEGFAQVFASDAVFDFSVGMEVEAVGGPPVTPKGPVTRGRDNIIDWVTSSYSGGASLHHGHSHEIIIDSDTEAHGVIALDGYGLTLDRSTITHKTAGHYHEKYRFEDGAWRIAEVRLVPLYLGPNI